MGLAPYGKPEVYRPVLESFYSLLPEGRFEIHSEYFNVLNNIAGMPRSKGEPFTQVHKDVAAAIQDASERIVFHLLSYYQEKYGHRQICLAGGVAQNCTINGKLLYSGMYDDVFVQPASYDAGTSIGAALYTYYEESNTKPTGNPRLEHVYWGSDIGDNDSIAKKLIGWEAIVDYEKVEHITKKTAELLAKGAVIGWSQGKSEFGPRALGNRSIVADPRPPENKDIINAMVKKREAFRPFAPSVLDEYVEEYYEAPLKYKKFPFMTFVLNVKKEKQEILGAVTHFDGTSRIQSVSKETNPKYWELIDEFRKITGIPILLNTSFNNNVEPIVNSFEDSITCFLTTKLNYLVVGDYLISKKEIDNLNYLSMVPSLPLHILLTHRKSLISATEYENVYEIRDNFLTSSQSVSEESHLFPQMAFGMIKENVSEALYSLLLQVDGKKSLAELMNKHGAADDERKRSLIDEMLKLWTLRLIKLTPLRGEA
jgi:carbamoyltransferase